jgi:RHS repeat-associated protein
MGDLGLMYYNARYYLPGAGRFLSADTIVPNPQNPQSLNRYAYVLNSPLGYKDPSGHDRCGVAGTTCLDEPPIIPVRGKWPFGDDTSYSSLINTEFGKVHSKQIHLYKTGTQRAERWHRDSQRKKRNPLKSLRVLCVSSV